VGLGGLLRSAQWSVLLVSGTCTTMDIQLRQYT
jgi:hypothetical protein